MFNDYIINNYTRVIILIKQLILPFLSKFKDVLYQVSSDLGKVNSLHRISSDMGQKDFYGFKKFKKPCPLWG